jgi:bifunctional DNase/RNase
MSGYKIEVEIVALTNSISGSHSYAVVIGETDGVRRIPIIIGHSEAQAIAVSLENVKNSRPLTHDMMKDMMETFSIDLKEVVIYKLKEGIFYSKLICKSPEGEKEIDSRTSDALAMASRFNTPIFTYESILSNAGYVDKNKEEEEAANYEPATAQTSSSNDNSLQDMSPEELNEMLNEAIENEDYIKAAAIRDELNKR